MAAIHKEKDLVLQGETLSDNIQKDAEIRSFLQGKDVSVELFSRSETLIASVRTAESREQAETGREVSLSKLVRTEHRSLKLENSQFRFSAQRALKGRPDQLAKIGIVVRKTGRKPKGEAKAEPPTPPPQAPAGEDVKPPEEPVAHGSRTGLAVPRFVARAEKDLGNALKEPDILKAMEPYGYGEPQVTRLVARVRGLQKAYNDWRTAEGMVRGAIRDVHAARQAFRLWYVPWRRKLIGALEERPDFLTRLGLPVPQKRERKPKGGAPEGDQGSA